MTDFLAVHIGIFAVYSMLFFKMELISISIAALALLASGMSLYYQFLHKPRRVRVITMPTSRNGNARFGLCNGGKECLYITSLSADFCIDNMNGMSRQYTVGEVFPTKESIIQPESILEFSYGIKRPPDWFLKDAPEKINLNGGSEKVLDVVICIQFAFPDGTIYSNRFRSGSCSFGKSSEGYKIEGVNMDLLKDALPVLKTKNNKKVEQRAAK